MTLSKNSAVKCILQVEMIIKRVYDQFFRTGNLKGYHQKIQGFDDIYNDDVWITVFPKCGKTFF